LLDQEQKAPFEVFNLGTGKGLSVFEMIEAFERSTGQKLNYKVVGRREGDIEKVYADTSYANAELGWKAEKGVDEMLLSAWKWEERLRSQKRK
jgi:UDP-glucose 4-epimerase